MDNRCNECQIGNCVDCRGATLEGPCMCECDAVEESMDSASEVIEGKIPVPESNVDMDEIFVTEEGYKTSQQHKKDSLVASQKAEMILVIRDIVTRFKRETDARLTSLATKVTSHLSTIVAASNDLTVTKHDLDLSLIRLEEDLKDAFGIKDTLDPNAAGAALFQEDEEGEPLDLFEAPAPGTDAVFDKLSADVDAVLGDNDPDDIEPGSQTDRRPFKAGDGAWN